MDSTSPDGIESEKSKVAKGTSGTIRHSSLAAAKSFRGTAAQSLKSVIKSTKFKQASKPDDEAAGVYVDEYGATRFRASESVNRGNTVELLRLTSLCDPGVATVLHDAAEELLLVKQAEAGNGGKDWHTDLELGWYLIHSGWMRQWLMFVMNKGPAPGEITNLVGLLVRKDAAVIRAASGAGGDPAVVKHKQRQPWVVVQRYRVSGGSEPLAVRTAPSYDAASNGSMLRAGDVFEVSEERRNVQQESMMMMVWNQGREYGRSTSCCSQ
jgi:hypothetical protein